MKRRKLLSREAIAELSERLSIGVPLATALSKLELDISRPTAKRLVKCYESGKFEESLFPPWLKETPRVQEEPDDWQYIGFFPVGEWQCKNSLT